MSCNTSSIVLLVELEIAHTSIMANALFLQPSAFTAALRYFEGKWSARNIPTGFKSNISKQEAIDIFLEGWTGPA